MLIFDNSQLLATEMSCPHWLHHRGSLWSVVSLGQHKNFPRRR